MRNTCSILKMQYQYFTKICLGHKRCWTVVKFACIRFDSLHKLLRPASFLRFQWLVHREKCSLIATVIESFLNYFATNSCLVHRKFRLFRGKKKINGKFVSVSRFSFWVITKQHTKIIYIKKTELLYQFLSGSDWFFLTDCSLSVEFLTVGAYKLPFIPWNILFVIS